MNAEQESALPRAVIHKQILNAAEERPDASMAELSDGINGATVELVERVLDEYGDPAEGTDEQVDTAPTEVDTQADRGDGDSMPGKNGHQGRSAEERRALTEKQRETLRAICDHPEATQAELAELLGVTAATINTRLNTIENFDWEQRHDFVERLAIDDAVESAGHQPDRGDDDGANGTVANGSTRQANGSTRQANGSTRQANGSAQETDEPGDQQRRTDARQTHPHRGRVDHLEGDVDATLGRPQLLAENPEVVHKVLRACFSSARISEDEELLVVKSLLGQSHR